MVPNRQHFKISLIHLQICLNIHQCMHSRRRQSDIESESSAADDEVFGLAPPPGGLKGTVSL